MNTGTLLLLGTLAALAIVAPRLAWLGRGLPSIVRRVADTGAVFILVGILIGPHAGNLFTADILDQLSPLLVLGLGWIGFLYGTHFEWRLLRRYPAALHGAALAQAAATLALVAGAAWWLLGGAVGAGLSGQDRLAAALILGICASGTAPAGVFQVFPPRRGSRETLNALRFVAAMDDLPAMVMLGVLHAFFRPGVATAGGFGWLVLSVAAGVLLGLAAHWLFPRGEDARNNFVILLGVTALGAGAAATLRLSPLFVTMLAGATFANLSHSKESAYGLLAEREHSIYVVFLLAAGLLVRFQAAHVLLLVPFFLLVRVLGKLLGGLLGWRLFLGHSRISPWLGGGLLFQGGMTLTMAISFARTDAVALATEIATTVVAAVLVNELFAPMAAGAVLRERGRP